jgi:hypothetical protein
MPNRRQHRDCPRPCHTRNERRLVAPGEALHSRQCSEERGRHLGPLEITGAQHEHAHGGGCDGSKSGWTIPDPAVLGQDDPPTLANHMEPRFVERIGWEVIVVNLDDRADVPKGPSHRVAAERAVDEEDEWVRRRRRRART